MVLLSDFTGPVLLLAFALSTCLYVNHLYNHETTLSGSGYAKHSITKTHERLVYNHPAKQHNSVEPKGMHPESSQGTDFSKEQKCTMATESRFDCAKDRLLSQRECEERGCCYSPLSNSTGPPWCFYPSLYPGYRMGPFTPTTRGQAATLTRTAPSYLPRAISILHLEVIGETAGGLHVTVSTWPSGLSLQPFKKTKSKSPEIFWCTDDSKTLIFEFLKICLHLTPKGGNI